MGLVAVLQRRGEFSHDKMGLESYPGACQVTIHGAVEGSESVFEAIYRESSEELGVGITVVAFPKEVLSLINDEKKKIVTYGLLQPPELLKGIRLGPSSGGLGLLTESEVDKIVDLRKFDKQTGVIDRTIVAMFPDEIEAVKKAFELFSRC